MSLPNRLSRPIVIEKRTYRWMIRDNRNFFALTVQAAAGRGQKLQVLFNTAGRYFALPGLHSITPESVCLLIKVGLDRGWMPGAIGKPQVFHMLDGDEILLNALS